MKAIIANPPWMYKGYYGVRATSRWPHLRKDRVIPPPIFHMYAAAVLEQNGIQVKGIDAVQKEMTIEEFVQEVKVSNPDYLFMETAYTSYNFDKLTIEALRKETPAKIVIFGPHSTAIGEQLMMENPNIDMAVKGEYDYTLSEIMQNQSNPEKVKGIAFRDGGRIVTTEPRPLITDIDSLPMPARHLYEIHGYEEPMYRRPNFLISTSRGCPYGCSFCVWPATIHGNMFRFRSAKNVVDEIELLVERYGAKSINIDDDTFTVRKDRVIEICDEILRRKLDITWYCYSRTNIDDIELYEKMAMSGCEIVRFGVESSSNSALKNVEKKLTVEQIRKGFHIAERAGIKTMGTFTFGLPGETKDDILNTIELSKKLNPFVVQYSFIVPFPGTKLYDQGKANGWFRDEDIDGFSGSVMPVLVPEGMTREELSSTVSGAYKSFYLRPSYIIKALGMSSDMHDLMRLARGFNSIVKRFGI